MVRCRNFQKNLEFANFFCNGIVNAITTHFNCFKTAILVKDALLHETIRANLD